MICFLNDALCRRRFMASVNIFFTLVMCLFIMMALFEGEFSGGQECVQTNILSFLFQNLTDKIFFAASVWLVN